MLLAEKEAKFKYCPHLTTNDGKFRFCQGTMCMMWRFGAGEKPDQEGRGFCGLAGKPEA